MPATAPSLPGLSRLLRGSPGTQISLSHYSAGEQHRRHAHDHVQVSFLITGSVQETIGRRGFEMTTSAACIKPIGADHEDLWGRNGALMLTVRLSRADLLSETEIETAKWRPCSAPSPLLVRSALTAVDECEVDALAADLIAALDPSDTRPERRAPEWLRRVVEALWDGEQLSASAAARIAGVHRVHLSRAFASHLGVPFSLYRKRVMISRAVEALLRSEDTLADIAADADFADQSHLHRSITALAGTTPQILRKSLASGRAPHGRRRPHVRTDRRPT